MAAKQFGRYRIIKHLATGGMAEVLLASATGIEGFTRHVVIKQIDEQSSQSPTFVKMFLDEARLAASLHHHNIIQVHDIGREGGTYFFAMEYVHGEDVRKLLAEILSRKSETPLDHAITIISAAASALHYAHEHCGPDRKPLNLVHRDVSPSNILVGFDGNVKVVDFGIAKTAQATTETRVGDIKGKFSYMSPEQCLGQPVDRRSDVFALGIVLYELVTVRKLFKGTTDFAKMKEVIEGTIAPPSLYRQNIPPDLDSIILKALEKDPAERYQTADELRVALEKFAIKHSLRMSTSGLADYMKQLFGDRPAPWLSEDSEPDVEISAAEPASTSAVPSEVPAAPSRSVVVPVVKLRANAVTAGYPEGYVETAMAPDVHTASTRRIPTFPAGATTATTESAADGDTDSKTPMAWTSEPQAPAAPIAARPRRAWRIPGLAAAVVVPVLVVGFTVMRSSSAAQQEAPVRASAAPSAAPTAVAPRLPAPAVAAPRAPAPRVAAPMAAAPRVAAPTAAAPMAAAPRVAAPTAAAPIAAAPRVAAPTAAAPTAAVPQVPAPAVAASTAAAPRVAAPPVAAQPVAPPAPPTPAPTPPPVTHVERAAAAPPREEASPPPPPTKRAEKKRRTHEPKRAKKPAWDPDALIPE